MATPVIASVASTTAASNTTMSITAPSSIARGDLLIAVIATTNTSTLSTPSDWTLLNAASIGQASYWKIAASNEPSTFTWTWTTASVSCGIILRITGASVMPIDTNNAQANTSSVNITAPTLTPRPINDLLVNIYATNTANTITVPAPQSNTGGVTGNSRAIICGYETLGNTFATGTITSNATNVSNNDTVTIGGQVYTFKTALTPTNGEVLIAANASSSLTNLQRAINNSGGIPNTDYKVGAASAWVTCGNVISHVLTITSIGDGTTGNSTTLAKSAVTLTVSGAVLSGAVNGNGATGTRVATSTAAINYGFSIAVREPSIIATELPNGALNTRILGTNYPNAAIVGDGAGASSIHTVGLYHGLYKLIIYTKLQGNLGPGYRVVVTPHNNPNVILRGGITDASGTLTFTNLAAGYYTIYAIDTDDVRRGVIADYVQSVAM